MIQLYLEQYLVDIAPKTKINLTYETTDYTEPQAKLTSYSKTVNLVGTANNDFVFGSIYKMETEIQNSESMGINFDPTKKHSFHIDRNGEAVESGYFTLDGISVKNGVKTYSITLWGGAADFFYNLQYKDDDESDEMTLGDLYYGIDGLTPLVEETKTLFNYNAYWIKDAWEYTKSHSDSFDTSSKYMFCPAPVYNGYDVEEPESVLINANVLFGYAEGWNSWYTDNKLYSAYKGWVLCKAQRGLDPWEVGSLRAQKMRLAIRNENIFKAICNPINNGGYEVDISNLDEKTLKYINTSYIILDKFDWDNAADDQNKRGLVFSKDSIWNRWISGYDYPTESQKAPIYTDVYDIEDFNTPTLVLDILPRIEVARRGSNETINAFNPNATTTTGQSALFTTYITRRNIWRDGYDLGGQSWSEIAVRPDRALSSYYPNYSTFNERWKKTIDSPLVDLFTVGLTFTWIDFLDATGNVIKQTKAYLYGCPSDVVKARDNYDGNLVYNNMPWSTFSYGEVKFCFEDFKRNHSEYSGTTYDATYAYKGVYHPNTFTGRTDEWVGDPYKIEEEIPSNSVKFRVNSVFHSTTRPRITRGIVKNDNVTFQNLEYDYYTPSFVQYNYQLPACPSSVTTKQYVEMASEGVTNYIDTIDWYTTEKRYFVDDYRCYTDIKNDNTSINDGEQVGDENYSLTKKIIFSNTCSPYKWLISIGKLFNLVFTKDLVENKIYIWNKSSYFDKKVFNIQDKIDKTQYSINPRTVEYNKYKYFLEQDESYASKLYDKQNKIKYGERIYKPNFNLNTESKEVLEDVTFKSAIPYQMHSVFFTPSSKWLPPQKGATYEWTLFHTENGEFQTETKEFQGAMIARDVTETNDPQPKLCFFNEENEGIDANMCFCFIQDWITPSTPLYVVDTPPIMKTLANKDVHVLVGMGPVSVSAFAEQQKLLSFYANNYPLFGNLSKDNLSSLFTPTDNYINIYDYFHKSELEQLYTKQNKKITIKYRLEENPNEAMRHYYCFDNSYFIINKINDYDVANTGFTECEFVKINDPNLWGDAHVEVIELEYYYEISDNYSTPLPDFPSNPIIQVDDRRIYRTPRG